MKKEDLEIVDAKVLHNGISFINSPVKILELVIFNNTVVLLLDAKELLSERNILGYSLEGKFMWQIPEPVNLHGDNFYTAIYLKDNDGLQAYSINGVEVTINGETGEIIRKELIK